jgi:hypothetical protein
VIVVAEHPLLAFYLVEVLTNSSSAELDLFRTDRSTVTAMLLNQLKTTTVVAGPAGLSSAASTLRGSKSSLVAVPRKSNSPGPRLGPLQVLASSSASSGGWLESSARAPSGVETAQRSSARSKHDDESTAQYNGTAIVVKSTDQNANSEDDASELEGKHVTVQLVSSEIDPSMCLESHPVNRKLSLSAV